MKSLSNHSSNKHLFLSTFISTFYLIVLSILKYNSNGLPIIKYDPYFFGNVLNILIWLVFLLGIIWYKIFSEKKKGEQFSLLTFIQLLSIICLALVIILFYIFNIEFSGYLFHIPIKKIIIGMFYILSGICQIFSVVYIWSNIFSLKEYFFLKISYKTFLGGLFLLLLSLIVVWIYPATISDYENKKYTFALIPGAAVWSKNKPSPIFEGRIKKADELFKKNTINKIIVIGGNAPGEITEAEAAQRYLVNLGIPKQSIILEPITSTTSEQIKYLHTSKILQNPNEEILVISDGFHLTRIIQICKFYQINGIGIPSNHKLTIDKEIFYKLRESLALLLFWMFSI
jgi:vancomycin permeability regulator SanA